MADVVPETFVRRVLETLTPRDCGSDLVRIGPEGDGGYLVPAAQLDRIELVLSAGLGGSSGFEDEMLTRFGVASSIIDGSMDRPSALPSAHRFHRRWLADTSSADRWSLADWVAADAADAHDMLLQIDIEGSEYQALASVDSAVLERFRIVIIELHGLGRLVRRTGFTRIAPLVAALNEQFVVVHAHPNNCCGVVHHGELLIPDVIEVTWLRRTAVGAGWTPDRNAPLPHPLDRRNVAERADIDLWAGWPAPLRA